MGFITVSKQVYWRTMVVLSLSTLLLACEIDQSESKALYESTARLQAISFLSPSVIAVTDSAYHGGKWGEGRVILVDIQRKETLLAWFTPIANPQALSYVECELAILSSGTLILGANPKGSWSSLSLLEYSGDHLSSLQDTLIYSEPKGSYLVDFVIAPEREESQHSWELSSGVDGVLWRVAQTHHDIDVSAQRFAPRELLSLGALTSWRSYTLLIEFNQDRLYIFDHSGAPLPCSPELGQYEEVMEGAQTPKVRGDRLWISFGLSGLLSHIDLDTLDLQDPTCSIDPFVYDPPLGQVPNDLLIRGDEVLVLHSAESALWTYNINSGERVERRMLDTQTNPWHLAISPDEQTLAISEWLRGGVSLLKASEGGELTQLPPSLFASPFPPSCARPIEMTSQRDREEGLAIDERGQTLTWETLPSTSGVDSKMLQRAPQLALSFTSDSGAAAFEYKQPNDQQWRRLTSLDHLKLVVLDPSMTDFQQEPPPSARSTALSEAPLGLYFRPNESSSSTASADPCSLFSPSFGAMRLPLHDEVTLNHREEEHHREEEGKRPLYQLRITALDSQQPLTLKDVAYRRW